MQTVANRGDAFLIVALVILVLAGLAANAMAGLFRGSAAQAGHGNPDLLANMARVAVWSFAIVIAVHQSGITTTLVNTLLVGFVGALTLALGLAFGRGGRDTAAEMVRARYRQGRQAAPCIEQAARKAHRQVEAESSQATTYASGGARIVPDIRQR